MARAEASGHRFADLAVTQHPLTQSRQGLHVPTPMQRSATALQPTITPPQIGSAAPVQRIFGTLRKWISPTKQEVAHDLTQRGHQVGGRLGEAMQNEEFHNLYWKDNPSLFRKQWWSNKWDSAKKFGRKAKKALTTKEGFKQQFMTKKGLMGVGRGLLKLTPFASSLVDFWDANKERKAGNRYNQFLYRPHDKDGIEMERMDHGQEEEKRKLEMAKLAGELKKHHRSKMYRKIGSGIFGGLASLATMKMPGIHVVGGAAGGLISTGINKAFTSAVQSGTKFVLGEGLDKGLTEFHGKLAGTRIKGEEADTLLKYLARRGHKDAQTMFDTAEHPKKSPNERSKLLHQHSIDHELLEDGKW